MSYTLKELAKENVTLHCWDTEKGILKITRSDKYYLLLSGVAIDTSKDSKVSVWCNDVFNDVYGAYTEVEYNG